ncbi:hypothetical protein VTN77DRAFT_3561 [Rasamsonia byssochlamydoides]|uniref:uncharacterized protein n=1 Tax=Rasamsonia byssochlamydoides TaxID=89139 RepID=UPI0037438141
MITSFVTPVTCWIFKIRIGTWPKDPKLKELGKWHQVAQEESMGPYSYALFSHVLGWERSEIEELLAMARKELWDPSIHQYVQIYIGIRRPTSAKYRGSLTLHESRLADGFLGPFHA